MLKQLLDEKNPIWIKVYKILVIVSAIAILIVGFILGVGEATSYIYGAHFDEFLKYFGIAVVLAAWDYVSGMLVSNFLSNVQAIREKLEEK